MFARELERSPDAHDDEDEHDDGDDDRDHIKHATEVSEVVLVFYSASGRKSFCSLVLLDYYACSTIL